MDLVSLIGVAGTGIGALGLGASLYQIHKRKESKQQRMKMRQRLHRKEDLEELSDGLRELHDHIQRLHDETLNHRLNEDIELFLHTLARDMMAYRHVTDETPVVIVEEVSAGIGDSKMVFNTASEIVAEYRKGEDMPLIRATTTVEDKEKVLEFTRRADIAETVRGAIWVRIQLEEICDDHEDLLSQFDRELSDNIDDTLDRLISACYGRIFECSDGVEFELDEYRTPVEVENAVYETLVLSPEARDVLDDLDDLASRVDDVQTDVVKTSFS